MSDVGSVTEAVNAMSSVQEKLREGSTQTGAVVEFLDRMASELGAIGLEDTVSKIEAIKQLVEEFVTELDGLSDEAIGAIQNELDGLTSR